MRVLVVLALALFLTGAAAAGSARRTTVSPLSLGSLSELSGAVALGGSGDGQRLRFLPNRKFAAGILLQNASRAPVVVENAAVVEPARTLIHQTGARFHAWRFAKCPPGASCPAPTFRIGSGLAHHPRPFTLQRGGEVGVELDFRLGSCADVPGASSAPISRLRVTFRTAGGRQRQHVFAFGFDSLRLRMPKPEDCSFPRSTLFVNDPSHIGTSYYFTIPGSKGDVCSESGGGLVFRSRAMKNDDYVPERVEIRIPGFAGTGTYHGATAAAVVDGKTVFHTPAVVTVTKATNGEVFAKVQADRLRPQASTVPYRIYGWLRYRVSG
jgi:hypothetical protein